MAEYPAPTENPPIFNLLDFIHQIDETFLDENFLRLKAQGDEDMNGNGITNMKSGGALIGTANAANMDDVAAGIAGLYLPLAGGTMDVGNTGINMNGGNILTEGGGINLALGATPQGDITGADNITAETSITSKGQLSVTGQNIKLGNVNYIFPAGYGVTNNVLTDTDGAGTLAWAAPTTTRQIYSCVVKLKAAQTSTTEGIAAMRVSADLNNGTTTLIQLDEFPIFPATMPTSGGFIGFGATLMPMKGIIRSCSLIFPYSEGSLVASIVQSSPAVTWSKLMTSALTPLATFSATGGIDANTTHSLIPQIATQPLAGEFAAGSCLAFYIKPTYDFVQNHVDGQNMYHFNAVIDFYY
tara:strand:+ start:4055 stop:5122 length:1068 start_codon:yes stop_codon:yes gene_type:complete